MGHPAGRKEASRARILQQAGRGFRSHGYGGIGVDGIARAAGVTSGGFYAHFRSKAAAFEAAVRAGLDELRAGIATLRETAGPGWRRAFVDFYLSDRRTCDLSESCALQSLAGEVARADDGAREAFRGELDSVIAAYADGLAGGSAAERRSAAIAQLALLVGGVTLARAVGDPAVSEQIADAVRQAADRLEPGR